MREEGQRLGGHRFIPARRQSFNAVADRASINFAERAVLPTFHSEAREQSSAAMVRVPGPASLEARPFHFSRRPRRSSASQWSSSLANALGRVFHAARSFNFDHTGMANRLRDIRRHVAVVSIWISDHANLLPGMSRKA